MIFGIGVISGVISLSLGALAASPPISESARKTSQGDPDFTQQEVNRLKEEVINKKTQLQLYEHLVKTESAESSYPVLVANYVNEMSSRYRVDGLIVTMDQERIYSYKLEDNLGKQALSRETQIYKAPVVPGVHELSVEITYRGNDTGIFSYINDYKISTVGKQTFELKKGQNVKVEVVGYEKGWVLTDFKDRPDIRIKIYGANPPNSVQ